MSSDDLPLAGFAFPGPLRDQLVAAILSGDKSTTSGLVVDYEHEDDPLPLPGLRQQTGKETQAMRCNKSNRD